MSLKADRKPVQVWYWPPDYIGGRWVKVCRYIEHTNGCLTAMLPGNRKVLFSESDWRKVDRES